MFGGMENELAHWLFAIPAVRGVEFGAGFAAARMRGSEHNDPFYFDEEGRVRTRANRHGGVLGGITSGMPLLVRAAFKPTPSIAREQETVNLQTARPKRWWWAGGTIPASCPAPCPAWRRPWPWRFWTPCCNV